MSEPSKTIPPTAPAWSPDQPLRADATNEQMDARYMEVVESITASGRSEHVPALSAVAREFAAACVAASVVAAPSTPKQIDLQAEAERYDQTKVATVMRIVRTWLTADRPQHTSLAEVLDFGEQHV